jgi:hypothetical protein
MVIFIGLTFILSSVYYQRRLKHLAELPLKFNDLKNKNDRLNLILKAQSECSHTIVHYFRNIEYQLDNFLKKIDGNQDISEDECLLILNRCKDFLLNTTTSLQSYFTIASGYTCSITLKIALNDEVKKIVYVKTLFRDPLSLKKRRYVETAYSMPNGIYTAKDNTAFEIILSQSHTNNFYASDNLNAEYELHNYKNSNKFWNNHYNATIVVPICIVLGDNERNVIGFIAVDNLTAECGNLNDASKIEFLFSVGDLLYTFIQKYIKTISFAKERNFKTDVFHKQINSWG